MNDIVIVGGGHAGVQLCNALVAAGQGARIHLVCEEPLLPYQRPPLSKAFQKNPDEPLQWHRGEAWFAEHGIRVHRGDAALHVDRAGRRVTLHSGRRLDYEWLVLATGTRARRLPHLPEDLANVHVLRTAADAERLRAAWQDVQDLTVLGGGFIGLEVAATACALGKRTRVLESAPRLMLRSVSPELSEHVLSVHRANGLDVRVGVAVGGFEVRNGRLVSLEVDGERLDVDTLLLGIGAVAEHALATAAGLECDNGVLVDEHLRTSDPFVLAIGDCCSFPEPTTGQRLRLESVQNANDHARAAAGTILGSPQPYRALPWFWSEQGSVRLQMAGLVALQGQRHRRPGASPSSFSVLHYIEDQLVCVESVNAPADHIAARKLLEGGSSPEPKAACDPTRPLKALIGSVPSQ